MKHALKFFCGMVQRGIQKEAEGISPLRAHWTSQLSIARFTLSRPGNRQRVCVSKSLPGFPLWVSILTHRGLGQELPSWARCRRLTPWTFSAAARTSTWDRFGFASGCHGLKSAFFFFFRVGTPPFWAEPKERTEAMLRGPLTKRRTHIVDGAKIHFAGPLTSDTRRLWIDKLHLARISWDGSISIKTGNKPPSNCCRMFVHGLRRQEVLRH